MCDSWYKQVHTNTGNECSPTVTQDLIAALDGTEQAASCLSHLIPRKEPVVPTEWLTVWTSYPVCSFGGEKDPLPLPEIGMSRNIWIQAKNIYPDHKLTMRVPTA